MAKDITEEDLELLGELGVEADAPQKGGRSARDQRIIAGFEEIERFAQEKGKPPEHGETRDIFERLYAARLDRIRESAECRAILKDLDTQGLLGPEDDVQSSRVKEELTDEELLVSLGVEVAPAADVTKLVHVRPREEIKAAEEIAQRNPCKDFDQFQPIFEKVQRELENGQRQTLKYQDNAEVKKGDLFILDGQKLMVADLGDSFVSDYGRPDRRLRVVYDNGTESDLLIRSLQRALNKDKASRRITDPDLGPLFSNEEEEDDLPSGYIYVLRSKSVHPEIAAHRELIHKIGVTGGKVETRISNAATDATYLLAEVEVVATYKLYNINRARLESIIHRVFGAAQLDLTIQDRFGNPVKPHEWFLVPLSVINEVVEKIRDQSITDFVYDPEIAALKRIAANGT